MRNTTKRTGLLGVALVATVGWAAIDSMKLGPESRLWVEGTSTVRSFTCKAAVFDAAIESAGENPAAALLAGTQAVTTVKLTVPAERLDCGNGTMNGHMVKALKTKDHPTITFALESYDLAKSADSSVVTMHGALTLGGVTKPIALTGSLVPTATGAVRLQGLYELNMKEYQLSPPTLMLGTMRVGERVKVRFDLTMQ
ncbi:MAG: YceI family protein [Gemmatimonadetes bacterium]|nr:YceI family protein [Gemmatimonadota bacterium]